MGAGMGGGMSGPGWIPMLPLSWARLLAWHPQPIPVFPVACLLAAVAYTAGVMRLRRRGDVWQPGRTLAFFAGLLLTVEVTATGIGGYGMRMLSVHMVQHMVLSMGSPILLLLGAPVTLALRALPVAPRGSRGPREVLIAVLHSKLAKVLTAPWFTLPLFIASLYGLYFTSLFALLMGTWWGHDLMLAHFMVVGLLFFHPLLGVDPGPRRAQPVLGILELMAGMPFHAFFGIAVMMSSALITPVFADRPSSWPGTALADQGTAGAVAWAFAEIPTLVVLVVLFVRWRRAEERAAQRGDRAAERNNGAELAAYNRYLASLNRSG